MSYQLYLTSQGATKLATAAAAGGSVHLTQFVVGSGVDVDFSQRLDAQTLTAPQYQGAIESISPTDTPHQYAVACMVPPTAGGFTISEVGLIDSEGTLIWVGSLPSVQKPDANSPAAVDYRINCLVSVDNYNGTVTLVIDPNVVTATRQWTQQWTQSWVQANYFDQSQMTAQLGALQQQIAALLARPFEGIPLGGILTTSKDYADSEAVATDLGYGHWVRYGKGLTLVGHDPAVTVGGSPAWWATLGNITGEFSHTLTTDEMPSHTHKVADTKGIDGQGGGWDMNGNASNFIDSAGVQHTGGGQAHNNIQPSIVVAFWLRVSDPATATVPQLYEGNDASTLTHATTVTTPSNNSTDAPTQNVITHIGVKYYLYDLGDGLHAPSGDITDNPMDLKVTDREGHVDPDWAKITFQVPAGVTNVSQVTLTTTSQYIHLDTSTLSNGTITVIGTDEAYATKDQIGAFAEKATATITFTA